MFGGIVGLESQTGMFWKRLHKAFVAKRGVWGTPYPGNDNWRGRPVQGKTP